VTIETDYLVVGAGASGMAFADALVARSDADVVLVDRRHRPGGHWSDDYQFVRLHQPSAYYGVDSLALGADRVDEAGPNAGFYERATGAEMCAYYDRVLAETLLPTGRVRFLPMTDYLGEASGEHSVVSLLTGRASSIRVRRRIVDASYIATKIPSMHRPSFSVEPGARLIAPNDLLRIPEPASAFTIIGAGKTSMDSVCWLVDQGVSPDAIRWIRPRDPYVLDRAWTQPLKHVGSFAEWLARQYEAAAAAQSREDFLQRLEENRVLRRLDPSVRPAVYRGATLSAGEHETMARVENVVRLGRVLHIGLDSIQLDGGFVPIQPGEVHIDCSAHGVSSPPARPIFEDARITIQRIQAGIDPFSAALIGVVESSERADEEKNRLCPPNPVNWEALDFADALLITLESRAAWIGETDLRDWLAVTRLSPFRGAAEFLDERGREAVMRMLASTPAAIKNLKRIVHDR